MHYFHYETVLSSCDEHGIRTIALNRPERLNAMTAGLVQDVTAAFRDADSDAQTRVIILTGQGRAFSSGDDRKDQGYPESEEAARAFANAIQEMARTILMSDKPVVGAINGWAVGGGFELALNCDFSIWAESAKAFFPEVALNASVTGGASTLLPAMIGLNAARELLFFGEHQDAKRLLELGVAWKVVPDDELRQAATQVARRLAKLPPASVAAMKRLLNLPNLSAVLAAEADTIVERFLDPGTRIRIVGF